MKMQRGGEEGRGGFNRKILSERGRINACLNAAWKSGEVSVAVCVCVRARA